jgi:NAD(P)-dependent dehydrogenase (short-subunit alcohol dehydrogenase family)
MSREVDLAGTVAVVTGGGGGIGGAVSDVLAAAGAHVVVVDIDDHLAEDRVAAITAAGHSAEALIIDVRRPDDVERLASTVLGTHGRADVLVNNVGHYLRPTAFVDSDRTHWSALHDVNLAHVFACSHAFLPAMIEQGDGSIVNVSSVEGLRGYPPDPVYGAYKAAVVHFTRCLALEVAPHGVRVNAIAPDMANTLQTTRETKLRGRDPRLIESWVPLARFGEPEDFADVVLFLASDLSRFVTGQVIPVDGGTLVAGGLLRRSDGEDAWTNKPDRP